MSRSIVKLAGGVLIMLITIAGVSACTTEMVEPDYANQMTESALQSMSDGDYAEYIENFSPDARSSVTEADFDEASQLIKSLIGDYIDKEFWKTGEEGEYTIVYYKANFTDEPADVIVTVYFTEVDGEMYIAGFWLNSPKLRGE
jgi:hypothetical protein